MTIRLLAAAATGLVAACAAPPLAQLPATHPASPAAPEARTSSWPKLSEDEASAKTKTLLTP